MRIRIRDPESFWPGIRDQKKIRIWDKRPGSATLAVDGLSYVWLVASPFFFCQKAV